MAGEFELIEWIRRQPGRASPLLRIGPGDDLAVLNWPAGELLVAGVDQVLDGVHFDSSIHSPRDIGRKVMNRNLSDCAAMAAVPAGALAAVALPRGCSIDDAKELYLGLRDAGEAFDCPIIGGETGSWDGRLAVSVTILCRSAGIEPITRGGARAGDGIFVSGPLGGSILGRHMTFTPRVHLARELAQSGLISSMIDLSDGLSRDLRHLCDQSGVGAVIDARLVPIHDDARELSRRDAKISPLGHALHDGEDYELLLTARAAPAGVTRIGTIVVECGVWLEDQTSRKPLEIRGWEHRL